LARSRDGFVEQTKPQPCEASGGEDWFEAERDRERTLRARGNRSARVLDRVSMRGHEVFEIAAEPRESAAAGSNRRFRPQAPCDRCVE
jgi:hypothetical protein